MESTTEQDERLMGLVSSALAKPSGEREAWLRLACGGDEHLYGDALELIREEEKMGSFLLHPMIAFQDFPRPFHVGQLVAERFEITREIGEGGMGVVYEAFDRKRSLRVAIKSAKPGFQRLLSPELEGALTVRHPNVCRVNEIHTAHTEHGEIDFLTMEFLEGETLSAHLKTRGKLQESEAVPIARQLCGGLAEAHRSGVIHRDLKSANVILCDSPNGEQRAVITDFGLAGASGESDDFAGTPAYMAPELWQGEKTSTASDIYALGIILYEMVADTNLVNRESDDAWLPDTRGLSRSWARTIKRCLDPCPAQRPANADEVLASLERTSNKKVFLVLPLVALLSLAFPEVREWIYSHTMIRPQVRLVILPATGTDPPLEMASGVLQDVSIRLSHFRSGPREVEVISPTETAKLSVKTTDQALGIHATHILQTSIKPDGSDYIVEGSLIDLQTKAHIRDFSSRYTSATLGALPAAITGAVSAGLALHGDVKAEVLSPAATVPYDRGLHILTQDTQRIQEAIQLFEKAADLDPRSPLPLAGLVEAEARSFRDAKDASLLTSAEKHLQQARTLNPDSVSVHLAAGKLGEAEGHYEDAKEEYDRVAQIDPRNIEGLIGIAGMYDMLNKPEKAVGTYKAAIDLDPTYYEPYEYLGSFYYNHGDYTQAAENFKKVTELVPGMYVAYTNLAGALQYLDRYAEAEQVLNAALKIQQTAAGLNNMGALLVFEKRDADAVPYFERAVAKNPRNYVRLLNLADCHRRLGQAKKAATEYREALDLARLDVRENPRKADSRAYAAYFAARLGQRERARDEIEQALRLSPSDGRVLLMAALTYEVLEKRDLALAALGGATPQQLHELEHEPDLADFTRDSRFKLRDKNLKGGK